MLFERVASWVFSSSVQALRCERRNVTTRSRLVKLVLPEAVVLSSADDEVVDHQDFLAVDRLRALLEVLGQRLVRTRRRALPARVVVADDVARCPAHRDRSEYLLR